MKTYKGLPVCEKHGNIYKWNDVCKFCQAVKKPLRKVEDVLKEMEEKGLIPKFNKDDKNTNNNS